MYTLTLAGLPISIGANEAVHQQRLLDAEAEGPERHEEFYLDVFCDAQSKKKDEVHGAIVVLKDGQVRLWPKDAKTGLPKEDPDTGKAPHPFTGFYLPFPDEDLPHRPIPAAPILGLVSTIPESSTSKDQAQTRSAESPSSQEQSEAELDTNVGSKSRSKSETNPKSKSKSELDQDADSDSEEQDTTSEHNSKALSKQKSSSPSSKQKRNPGTKQKPKLNWIYVDRSTRQLRYGPRAKAKKHIVGSWDWTEDDEQGLTLDDEESLVAVEESRGGYGWAVYWDEKDNRLKDFDVGKEKRVLRCSLERRLVNKKRVKGLDESDED